MTRNWINYEDIVTISQNPVKDKYEVFVTLKGMAEPMKIYDATHYLETDTPEVVEEATTQCVKSLIGAWRGRDNGTSFFYLRNDDRYIENAREYIANGSRPVKKQYSQSQQYDNYNDRDWRSPRRYYEHPQRYGWQ